MLTCIVRWVDRHKNRACVSYGNGTNFYVYVAPSVTLKVGDQVQIMYSIIKENSPELV